MCYNRLIDLSSLKKVYIKWLKALTYAPSHKQPARPASYFYLHSSQLVTFILYTYLQLHRNYTELSIDFWLASYSYAPVAVLW